MMATWQNEDDHKTHTLPTGVTKRMVPATWEAPKNRKRKSTSRITVQSVLKRKKAEEAAVFQGQCTARLKEEQLLVNDY